MDDQKSDYVLTLFEACEVLNKSSRTIGRYVRKGILRPMAIKSRQGTLEYRFSRAELDALKKKEDELRQVTYLRQGTPMMPGMARFADMDLGNAARVVQTSQPGPVMADRIAQSDMGQIIQPVRPADIAPDKTDDNQPKEDTADSQKETLSPSPDKEIITLLKETTEILRDQLQVKDEQIKSLNDKIDNLIERDRETNILLKGMQDKILRLEQPKDSRDSAKADVAKSDTTAVQDMTTIETKETATKKDTQDKGATGEKSEKPDNKQKKNKPTKQNKGFWSGLFS